MGAGLQAFGAFGSAEVVERPLDLDDARPAGRRPGPGVSAPPRRKARRLSVMLLATVDTKAAEIAYLVDALADNGVHARVCDVSLDAGGRRLCPEQKVEAMRRTAADVVAGIGPLLGPGYQAIIGIGGGTGGQIIVDIMRALPFSYPKVLVTTLPFDPRSMLADNSIVVVPTLADISGLNATLRQSFDHAAALVAGICRNPRPRGHISDTPSIGITALSTTSGGVDPLRRFVQAHGREATVFHSNGYGGAAFARWCEAGAFDGVIDYTTHELTRLTLAGAHCDMPHRFTAAARAGIPQVVLPGAVNLIGLGEVTYVRKEYLDRPHYAHSHLFTHVQVSETEMRMCATVLAMHLKSARSPTHLLVPMGGFSSEDAPGGAVHHEGLRGVFLDTMRSALGDAVPITVIDEHINSEACAYAAFETLEAHL